MEGEEDKGKSKKEDGPRRFSDRFNIRSRFSGNLSRWSAKITDGGIERATNIGDAVLSSLTRSSTEETTLPTSPESEKKPLTFEPPPRTRSTLQRLLNAKIDQSTFLGHISNLFNQLDPENEKRKILASVYETILSSDSDDEPYRQKKEKNKRRGVEKSHSPSITMVTTEQMLMNITELKSEIKKIKNNRHIDSSTIKELLLLCDVWNFAIALYQGEEEKVRERFELLCDLNCVEEQFTGSISKTKHSPAFHKKHDNPHYDIFSDRIKTMLKEMFLVNPTIAKIDFDELAFLGRHYPFLYGNLIKIVREVKPEETPTNITETPSRMEP